MGMTKVKVKVKIKVKRVDSGVYYYELDFGQMGRKDFSWAAVRDWL